MLLPTRDIRDAVAKWWAVTAAVKRCRPAAGRCSSARGPSTTTASALPPNSTAAGIAFRLLNGKQDQDEAEIVAAAGQRGTVTIATNMAGRGTDIRPVPAWRPWADWHVIGVEQHESPRIDRQLWAAAPARRPGLGPVLRGGR